MSNRPSQQKLRMPRLLNVRLEHFTLYNSLPVIDLPFGDGVLCLAGANGLGKSTFLAAVNYGLTGIVADPERDFVSVPEYYERCLEFASEFFDGRISEDDRDRAVVILEFVAGTKHFNITRGVFEQEQLRKLVITDIVNNKSFDGKSLTATQRHRRFAETLVQEVGLKSFEQFVFLQQFVFTFDERRQLLFWDKRVLEQALHLCFGVDPHDALKADQLRRQAEGADSLVRNYQWQATGLRKKLEQLESVIDSDHAAVEYERVMKGYENLLAKRDAAEKRLAKMEDQRQDTEIQFVHATADVASTSAEYEKVFADYLASHGGPDAHPLVKQLFETLRCGLCGSNGESVANHVREKLASGNCPLCDSKVHKQGKTPETLRMVDAKLASEKDQLKQVTARRDRVLKEAEDAQKEFNMIVAEADRFERKHGSLLAGASLKPDAIQTTISGYREQIEALLKKKDVQYERREDKRRQLRKLQKKLISQYAEAEELFVPIFNELAYRFLGINLSVQLEAKAGGVFLMLSVKESARRKTFQLSESQRFFVDIALRMALIQFTSTVEPTACLLIDTPEGSLDIAYESRAGDMFATFVLQGFSLIMTANINTSQLLIMLARRCGKKHMRLCRMTSWAELSEVQRKEERLFGLAYKRIVAAQNKPNKRGAQFTHV
ncbi:MAG TPA: AAA family ATPase [Candidatus Angelobacter sp.]|nr:AAA family ATPase [Candidatus Angelobacter sp.]